MKVFLGADHRGFQLKEASKNFLQGQHEVIDMGNEVLNQEDDFTDYAILVSNEIVKNSDSKGVLFCGSGAGMEITANKVSGIRAFLGLNKEQVKSARNDDNVNVLVIASDFTDLNTTQGLLEAFLSTTFEANEKHERRIEKIKDLES